MAASATEADTANSNIDNAVMIPTRLMFLVLLTFPVLRLIVVNGRARER
jgi:hypothetical protein